jgi:branched-chain amino acid aminotransferase
VIASPAGAYFKGGVSPVSIWVSTHYSRAGKGGMGAAKTGGNYASSLVAQQEAYAHGCAQVLFLDSETGTYLEELGGMNVVFVGKDGSLLTPESSSILAGITLDSVLQLGRDRGLRVEQRRVSIDEVRLGVASGDIVEMFACGTAAVITPIAQFIADGYEIGTADAPAGELTMSLRQELTDIQYGRVPDRHGWLTRLDA